MSEPLEKKVKQFGDSPAKGNPHAIICDDKIKLNAETLEYFTSSQSLKEFQDAERDFIATCLLTASEMHLPAETKCKLLLFKDGKCHRSKIFPPLKDKNTNKKHAHEWAIDYLRYVNDWSKAICFTNYAPSNHFWRSKFAALGEGKNKIAFVFANYYIHQVYRSADYHFLEPERGNCALNHWRWTLFLLWNIGYIRDDLEWWTLQYEDCEEDILKGLEAASIEFTHPYTNTEKILEKLVYNGSGLTIPLNIKDISKGLHCELACYEEKDPCFSRGDLEQFFTSALTKGKSRENRVQIIAKRFPKDRKKHQAFLVKSQIFCQKSQIIKYMEEFGFRGEIVVITNGGLQSPDFLEEMIEQMIKEKGRHITKIIKVVTTKNVEGPMSKIDDIEVEFHRINNWRWNAFLLWNADSQGIFGPSNTWYKDPFEKCEGLIAESCNKMGIDYVHSKTYMDNLLRIPIYRDIVLRNQDGECSVKEMIDLMYSRDM